MLDAAHQQLAGPVVVVWDNLNSHVSAAMAELVAARDWLTVCQLPPYAHELNPVEPVWSHLKRSLANLAKRNLVQLTALVKTRLKRMQYRPPHSSQHPWTSHPSVTSTIRDPFLAEPADHGAQISDRRSRLIVRPGRTRPVYGWLHNYLYVIYRRLICV